MDRIHLSARSISPVRVSTARLCWPEKKVFVYGLKSRIRKGMRYLCALVSLRWSNYHQAQSWKETMSRFATIVFTREVTKGKRVECCIIMIGSPEISRILVK